MPSVVPAKPTSVSNKIRNANFVSCKRRLIGSQAPFALSGIATFSYALSIAFSYLWGNNNMNIDCINYGGACDGDAEKGPIATEFSSVPPVSPLSLFEAQLIRAAFTPMYQLRRSRIVAGRRKSSGVAGTKVEEFSREVRENCHPQKMVCYDEKKGCTHNR